MRVVGVICEYDPFHNGHALHLARARAQAQADYVVCAMSGSFTQRGTPALLDKWTRARMALMGGADLVVELPFAFCCAQAERFARGGVSLLGSLGVVTHLAFGCEPAGLPYLLPAASALERPPPRFREALAQALGEGCSYPRAQAEALAPELGGAQALQALRCPTSRSRWSTCGRCARSRRRCSRCPLCARAQAIMTRRLPARIRHAIRLAARRARGRKSHRRCRT